RRALAPLARAEWDRTRRQRERNEPLLRAAVQVALELSPGLVTGRDDALAGGLELLLLALTVGDLPDDHQELVVAAGREAPLVVARFALEVERVLDHARRASVHGRATGLEHPVGQLVRKPIPDGQS